MVRQQTIWDGVIKLFTEDRKEAIGVIDSLVDILRCDEETCNLHLPNLLSNLLHGIDYFVKQEDSQQLLSCLQLARKVFGKFSGFASKLTPARPEDPEEDLAQSEDEISEREKLHGLYKALLSYQNVLCNLCSCYIFPYFDIPEQISYLPINYGDVTINQRRKVVINAIELLVQIFIYLPCLDYGEQPTSHRDVPEWLATIRRCVHLSDPEISTVALVACVDLLTTSNSGISSFLSFLPYHLPFFLCFFPFLLSPPLIFFLLLSFSLNLHL